MAEAQDRKVMAAETQQESVLPESLLAVVGFNIKRVCGKSCMGQVGRVLELHLAPCFAFHLVILHE